MGPSAPLTPEFEFIENDAQQRCDHCYRMSIYYTWLHFCLGAAAVLLSAITGGAALREVAPGLIAGLAVALVVLTGLQTLLNPSVRTQYRANAIEYERLRDDAKLAREHELLSMNSDEALEKLHELRSRRYDLMKRSGGTIGPATAPSA